MKHFIDPTVDCVFKALLGKEENKNLLIHFLNAVLDLSAEQSIQEVTLLNPYNEREFLQDKLSIVDVKAKDVTGRHYQIEIQLAIHPGLESRILYTWSTIYHSLITKGEDFSQLRPVISIWILNENLFPQIEDYHLRFLLYNLEHRILMTNHLGIHLLELPKWYLQKSHQHELDRWMFLFKEGKHLDAEYPPNILHTKEMEQAMSVLKQFSETEENYLLYQSRLLAELEYNTWQNWIKQKTEEAERAQQALEQAQRELEEDRKQLQAIQKEKEAAEKEKEAAEKEKEAAEKEKEAAEKEKEAAEKEKKVAQKEQERLLALLKKAGIDPNQQ